VEERKQAEEALRESREKLRLMFESVTDGILVLDLNGVITDVNQKTVEMHGFNSKDELLGKNITELVAPSDRHRGASSMQQTIKRGAIRGIEYTMLKKDGSEFLVEVSASVLNDVTGKPVGRIAIGRDITERKRAEEKEKQLQQEVYRSSRLASIGELAAGVAHEINNPLTGVVGFSQRLLRKTSDEEVKRGLEIVHNEALRAAKIIQNLLTFARRSEPKKQYSDINGILQSALELRDYELKTSNIEVITDLAPSLSKALVDSHQIQEVFLNIILNAEQAMTEAHGRGKLTVKTEEIKDFIRISFADDGPGISPEHLDKLFDPFFTTREERGGTGLGLSVCHGILTEHGGRIYARSKLGVGAALFVELPVRTA
jgi:two-component system NtrC family sensor kinase